VSLVELKEMPREVNLQPGKSRFARGTSGQPSAFSGQLLEFQQDIAWEYSLIDRMRVRGHVMNMQRNHAIQLLEHVGLRAA
jgi:hypothetical protein